MRIIGYIPARLGSVRVPVKNLRLLNGHPLISYAIKALQGTSRLDDIVVNTESDIIANVAQEYGMRHYLRPTHLAGSSASTDEIVIDFLKHNSCSAVAVINPTAPFLTSATIDMAVEQFERERPNSLFSSNQLRRHSFIHGHAVNFDQSKKSPRTQDLEPLTLVNFIITIFDAEYALKAFSEKGSFLYNGRISFFNMKEEESFDIDNEFEFQMAELMLQKRVEWDMAQYHPSVDATRDHRS